MPARPERLGARIGGSAPRDKSAYGLDRELGLAIEANHADLRDGGRVAEPHRQRRFSEASDMVAPPVRDFEGAFQTMVVSEARTSPVAFSRGAVAAETAHKEQAAARLPSNCARAR
jgi:hypothetical protein